MLWLKSSLREIWTLIPYGEINVLNNDGCVFLYLFCYSAIGQCELVRQWLLSYSVGNTARKALAYVLLACDNNKIIWCWSCDSTEANLILSRDGTSKVWALIVREGGWECGANFCLGLSVACESVSPCIFVLFQVLVPGIMSAAWDSNHSGECRCHT